MTKKGVALVAAFMVVAVLSVLGVAMVSRSINESNIAKRHFESTQAFWLAEAGISRALKELRNNYNLTQIASTSLGQGAYSVAIAANPDGSRTVSATGFIPASSPYRANRTLEVIMNKYQSIPPHFYENAVYAGGNIVVSGSSYSVTGNIRYGGGEEIEHPENISGSLTQDSEISPLARLDFQQLRALSQSQGNYHDADHLSGPFPNSFWYNESQQIPNVVFLEGELDLSGKTQVAGFFVVGGEVIYDAALSGNVSVDGSIYTLGNFTIMGGGNVLNVNGGVWTGDTATLLGNAKIDYKQDYMLAIENLGINTDVQVLSWRDTQNPYKITP